MSAPNPPEGRSGPQYGAPQYGQQHYGQQHYGQQQYGPQQYGPQHGHDGPPPYGPPQPPPGYGPPPYGPPYGAQPPPFSQQIYGQQQNGQQQHGQHAGTNPLIPPGFGGVPLPADIPAPVQRAFQLWLAIIAVNVLGVVVTTIGVGDYVSGVGIVFALIGAAIGVFLALHFRGQRQWARLVLTVLTGLAMLSSLFALFGAFVLLAFAPVYGIVELAVTVVFLAGGTLALINAWNAQANAWFGRLGL
jgi:hypothetical protein